MSCHIDSIGGPRPFRRRAGDVPATENHLGLILLLAALLLPAAVLGGQVLSHPLSLVHPGEPNGDAVDQDLLEVLDDQGEPVGYQMWVDSVICREKVCDVVRVELFWDPLGRYLRYEVAPGKKLTKLEHEPFTPDDHAKLQSILRDTHSPLQEVTKEGLTGPKAKAGVDGVSGATVLTLASTVVIGAGYTCYDLWHWANGEVTDIIRAQSGKRCSDNRLRHYLADADADTARFAVSALLQRQVRDPATIAAVAARAKTAEGDLFLTVLDYLRAVTDSREAFHERLAQLFNDGDEAQRLKLIELIGKETPMPSADFLANLSQTLPIMSTYQEVHSFLGLVRQCDGGSNAINANVAKLLTHKKFLIARRAYWYLEKLDLPAELRRQADAFYEQYQDRL